MPRHRKQHSATKISNSIRFFFSISFCYFFFSPVLFFIVSTIKISAVLLSRYFPFFGFSDEKAINYGSIDPWCVSTAHTAPTQHNLSIIYGSYDAHLYWISYISGGKKTGQRPGPLWENRSNKDFFPPPLILFLFFVGSFLSNSSVYWVFFTGNFFVCQFDGLFYREAASISFHIWCSSIFHQEL